MKLFFWLSLALIAFVYAGYPICLYFKARLWPKVVRRQRLLPKVTIILTVHNEEKKLHRKLQNLSELNYPGQLLETIVVSDGSTDRTNSILTDWEQSSRRAVMLPTHGGKASALNAGIAEATGEVICFTDARQTLASDALMTLVSNFADATIGCVSGELMLGKDQSLTCLEGVGLYWKLEKLIRNWEGKSGSTIGATGAFYAVRRNLLLPIPPGTILDDVYIPLVIARQGSRVIFDSQAVAWDDFTPSPREEFRRKVRTLTGVYQLLVLAPWSLSHLNPLRFRFVCHKLLRLLMPFALIGVFISTIRIHESFYELALVLQIIVCTVAVMRMAGLSLGPVTRFANIVAAFMMLNTAAVLALFNFLMRRKAEWVR